LLQRKWGLLVSLRWLGLQAGKYVSLPKDWVGHNFDESLLVEARLRADQALVGRKQKKKERFLPLPVGDSRNKDPPSAIRYNQGLNYYYQGHHDNCVMGGLVNMVYRMTGPANPKALLEGYMPTLIHDLWFKFVQHVIQAMRDRYHIRRVTKPKDILRMDRSFPLVVQLKSTNNSESHAICIFNDCIYDSASQYVLSKSLATLNWCCGAYDYARHLRIYRLEPMETKGAFPKMAKKR
jgi:hypothetical protein